MDNLRVRITIAPWVPLVVALVDELRRAGAVISEEQVDRMTQSRAFTELVVAGTRVEVA